MSAPDPGGRPSDSDESSTIPSTIPRRLTPTQHDQRTSSPPMTPYPFPVLAMEVSSKIPSTVSRRLPPNQVLHGMSSPPMTSISNHRTQGTSTIPSTIPRRMPPLQVGHGNGMSSPPPTLYPAGMEESSTIPSTIPRRLPAAPTPHLFPGREANLTTAP